MLKTVLDFAECSECGGDIQIIIWGKSYDSGFACVDCGEEKIIR